MSHEHGGGEEAIRRSNLEAQQYNDAKRSRRLGQETMQKAIEERLIEIEAQTEVIEPMEDQ